MSRRAVIASAPEHAPALIAEHSSIHLVLLNLALPNLDTIALAQRIYQCRPQGAISVVFLASVVDTMLKQRARQEKLGKFLAKPVRLHELASLLSDVTALPVLSQIQTKVTDELDATLGQNHPLQILLVEDNPTNQKVALLLLKRLGYQADVASNGIEAVEAVRRQHYDLVLMDIQMPEMDGLTATRQILTEQTPENRPYVIALSAGAMTDERIRCLEAGMIDFVPKPIPLPILTSALSKVATQLRETA